MKTYILTCSYGAPGSNASRFKVRTDGNTLIDAIANALDSGTLSRTARLSSFGVVTAAESVKTFDLVSDN